MRITELASLLTSTCDFYAVLPDLLDWEEKNGKNRLSMMTDDCIDYPTISLNTS